MSSIPLTATLLALALVLLPGPALSRLRPPRGRPPRRLAVPVVIGGGIAAAAVTPPAVLVAGALVAAVLTTRMRRRRRDRRRTAEGQSLAAALETLVGELRAGAHPVSAFGAAAAEADGTVGAAMRAVAARARLGADVAAGLDAMASASSVPPYWSRLAVCWRLGADHGLAMSTLMSAAQHDIVERQRFSARVQAGLAGARTTATILATLPLLGVLLGEFIGARPLAFLFGPGAGGAVLVAGVLLICLGLAWSDRVIDRLPA